VLAALLSAGGPVPRDQLLEWFWADLDPERGTRAFHVAMSGLRRAVEPTLERGAASALVVTEGDSYRVALSEGVSFDAAQFLVLVDAAAGDGDADSQRAKLTSALALHGGEPYPEWPYEPWVEGLRARIHRAHVHALEALGDNLIDSGRAAEAVEPLATLVEADPGHEAAHRGLMRAYAAAGERARGLRQFHACRSSLVREQGVEPSPATRELYASLLGDA
jgi:DNA-binding SARP family transcriptional activator